MAVCVCTHETVVPGFQLPRIGRWGNGSFPISASWDKWNGLDSGMLLGEYVPGQGSILLSFRFSLDIDSNFALIIAADQL